MELRFCKIAITGSLALFALLCGFDNITDYNTNFAFVGHVLSMDTTFAGNALRDRAITQPLIWRLGYALIIGTEFLVGACYLTATVQMLRRMRTSAARFNEAKRLVHVATGLAFLLWFTGFMAAVEWPGTGVPVLHHGLGCGDFRGSKRYRLSHQRAHHGETVTPASKLNIYRRALVGVRNACDHTLVAQHVARP